MTDETPMTAERVKEIREMLGLSQRGLATLLRLKEPHGKYTVARWEKGRTIPGPVQVALEALEAGWRPGDRNWNELREEALQLLGQLAGTLRKPGSATRDRAGRKDSA